jgi:hypothetical protein
MTVFGCADAHGVVVYNGIGLDDEGQTPSDWLMKLAENKLFESSLQDVLNAVEADLEARLQKLRVTYGWKNARHTFTSPFGMKASPRFTPSQIMSRLTGEDLLEGNETVTQAQFLPPPDAKSKVS